MTDFASVCVLSYNRPKFLRDCIRSMRDAGAPFELIVHDDGSTDPAVRELILDGLDRGWISHAMLNPPGHNEGQGIALNRMFHAAHGDPIIKCDQDVVFTPGWLERANEILDSSRDKTLPSVPEIGLLGFFKYWHDPVDWRKTLITRRHDLGYEVHEIICGSAFALTRSAWETLGPFEERSSAFAEDHLMQKAVTEQDGLCCALPAEDLVTNQGFGIGPSTLALDDGNGGITTATIKDGPLLQGRRWTGVAT